MWLYEVYDLGGCGSESRDVAQLKRDATIRHGPCGEYAASVRPTPRCSLGTSTMIM